MRTLLFAIAVFLIASSHAKAQSEMSVSSSAFQNGEEIGTKFTCNGKNVSPELRISGAPATAKSLALVVDDPDAPGGLFTHWLVWNVDARTRQLGENSAPAGSVAGTNDFGKHGYGGPCPPSGTHRYFFRIFALDTKLELKAGAKRAELEKAISGHIIAKAELMARCTHK